MRVQFQARAEGAPPSDQVEKLLTSEFPPPPTDLDGAEGLLQIFMGSRNTRQGAAPDREAMEAMLGVIRHYMGAKRPVPVLVPSGPKKNGTGAGVDLAELSALRVLGCLQSSAVRFHEPGFAFFFRMEDATGHWLEGTSPETIASIDGYIDGLAHLVSVLGYGGFITLVRETDIVPSSVFSAEAAELLPYFLAAVLTGDTSKLAEIGWRGGLQPETLEFLMERYRRIYPDQNDGFRRHMIARYLSSTMGRVRLRASGAQEDWDGGRLEVAFQAQMPGTPSISPTRVNYRTVPVKHSKLHIPFWRAKGVIKRKKGVKFGLCHWGSDGYGEAVAVLKKKNEDAVVSCDFERGER